MKGAVESYRFIFTGKRLTYPIRTYWSHILFSIIKCYSSSYSFCLMAVTSLRHSWILTPGCQSGLPSDCLVGELRPLLDKRMLCESVPVALDCATNSFHCALDQRSIKAVNHTRSKDWKEWRGVTRRPTEWKAMQIAENVFPAEDSHAITPRQ
jgi:hypothetical protein